MTHADQRVNVSPPCGGLIRQQTATPTATPPVGLQTRQLCPSAPEPNTAGPWWTVPQSVMVQPDGQDSSTCRSNRNTASDGQVCLICFVFSFFVFNYASEQHVPPLDQLSSFAPGGTPVQEHGSTQHVMSCHHSQCSASCC